MKYDTYKPVIGLEIHQLDPMVASLQDTDATAMKLWKAARHVVKPQSTPTQLLALVSTQDGEALVPVADAVFMAINGTKHAATTNEKGEAALNPLPFGIYDYQCELPGYQSFLLKQQKVVRCRVNKVAVVLKRAA